LVGQFPSAPIPFSPNKQKKRCWLPCFNLRQAALRRRDFRSPFAFRCFDFCVPYAEGTRQPSSVNGKVSFHIRGVGLSIAPECPPSRAPIIGLLFQEKIRSSFLVGITFYLEIKKTS